MEIDKILPYIALVFIVLLFVALVLSFWQSKMTSSKHKKVHARYNLARLTAINQITTVPLTLQAHKEILDRITDQRLPDRNAWDEFGAARFTARQAVLRASQALTHLSLAYDWATKAIDITPTSAIYSTHLAALNRESRQLRKAVDAADTAVDTLCDMQQSPVGLQMRRDAIYKRIEDFNETTCYSPRTPVFMLTEEYARFQKDLSQSRTAVNVLKDQILRGDDRAFLHKALTDLERNVIDLAKRYRQLAKDEDHYELFELKDGDL